MDMRRVEERWGREEHAHLSAITWMNSPAVQLHLNERSTGDPALDWLSAWAHRFFVGEGLRVLVLGCGEGWLERALAVRPFVASIDALDVAAEAVERARAAAEAAGIGNIRYATADLNSAVLKERFYDAVVAHSILHHVENLEHAFGAIAAAMKPDASLIVSEYVGPNRFQFGDDVLAIMNDLFAALPQRLRVSALEGTVYERRSRPSVEEIVAADPSEAVRSADLRALIAREFTVLDTVELGGTILQHLLYDVVQNFRFDVPRERVLVELLATFEGALVDRGTLPSDFVLLAARLRSSTLSPAAYDRQRPPRPPEARDADPDPLGKGPRRRVPPVGMRRPLLLPRWSLRMLRVLLASERGARRPLIEERIANAAVEQLRYGTARGAGVFDWITGRWLAAAGGDAADRDATLGLLQTFARIAGRTGLT